MWPRSIGWIGFALPRLFAIVETTRPIVPGRVATSETRVIFPPAVSSDEGTVPPCPSPTASSEGGSSPAASSDEGRSHQLRREMGDHRLPRQDEGKLVPSVYLAFE